jgi:hypothetical protein
VTRKAPLDRRCDGDGDDACHDPIKLDGQCCTIGKFVQCCAE